MKMTILKAMAALFAVAFVVFAVWAWTRVIDRETSDRYAETLRTLETLDSRLIEETMKARAGLVAHYDGIAKTEAALKRTHDRLAIMPAFLSRGGRADVTTALEASSKGHVETQRLIERFKSEHSILRNSLHFLPVAATEVDAFMPTTPDGIEFKSLVSSLVRDVLLQQVWGSPRTKARIERSLEKLAGLEDTGPWSDEDLQLVRKHAIIVKDKTPVVDELTRAIGDAPIEQRSRELVMTYSLHYRAAMDRSNRDLSILFVIALLLITTASAFVILRFRQSALELQASGAELATVVENLRVEKEKQKELAELKSRFVSMTSHQFRTPLSVIVSSSEMLSVYAQTMSDEKKDGHLRGIRAAALGMTKMLDKILMIGRSDSGMLELNPGVMELEEFCEDVVASTEQSMESIGAIVRKGPGRAETVVADGELLRHILENLLSNAIKYSPDDSKVEFDIWRDGDEMVFEVSDHGIGIPECDQAQLFETFYRASNVGKIRGTGLGLAIVKRAVGLHHGSLSVKSAEGQGTKFTVRLPCPREAA